MNRLAVSLITAAPDSSSLESATLGLTGFEAYPAIHEGMLGDRLPHRPSQFSISETWLATFSKTAIQKGPHLKRHYIFIDFENVQPKDLALLKGHEFKVMIFVGSTQAKLPTEFAIAAQALGPLAEYVQIDGSGRNALDFHIAYYLGSMSAVAASGESFVISKDTGFDPLMRHLKSKGIPCRRLPSIEDIPGLKETAIKPTSDPIQRILANFAKRASAKPRTLKTLRSSIKNLLGPQGTEQAVEKCIGELKLLNAITITDGKVAYQS